MAPKGKKTELKMAAPEPESEALKAALAADGKAAAEPVNEGVVSAPASDTKSEPKPESARATSKDETDLVVKKAGSGGTPEAEKLSPKTSNEPDKPPPIPRRPPSPFNSQLNDLREAFPDTTDGVRRAVLVAASGNLENAFNGLLALSDDSIRPPPPPQVRNERERSQESQLRRDEELARRLASQYSQNERRRPVRRSGSRESDLYDQEEGFGDGLQRGLSETGRQIQSLWGQLRERFNNEVNDEDDIDEYLASTPPPRLPRRTREQGQEFVEAPLPARDRSEANTSIGGSGKVNVFGDQSPLPSKAPATGKAWELPKQPSEQPDAFFIGESDDDDLGSLEDGDGAAEETAKSSSREQKDSEEKEETGDPSISKSPSAKELLAKLKANADTTS